jgi:hypothetical protein
MSRAIPTHGDFGGPLACVIARYEDGTDRVLTRGALAEVGWKAQYIAERERAETAECQLTAANRALALIAPVIEEAMVFCGNEWFEHESWWREQTKPWHTFQQLNQQTALLASDKDAIDVMRTVACAAGGEKR